MKWEYKVVKIAAVDIDAGERQINEMGAEGWRYITALGDNHFLFERELPVFNVFHEAVPVVWTDM